MPTDIFTASDEEFLTLPPPTVETNAPVVTTAEAPTPAPENGAGTETVTDPVDPPQPVVNTEVVTQQEPTPEEIEAKKKAEEQEKLDNPENQVDNPAKPGEEPQKVSTDNSEGDPAVVTPTPNYEEFYKQVMAPFKANGKVIELKDPAEAVQLMQMGANYTKNMQQLAPHRKLLMTLQNAGLADNSDALNFLIDLHQKKPEAITKLLADANINPLDIDVSTANSYIASNHQVADATVAFKATLDEINSTPDGVKTISLVQSWDQASIDAAYANPAILTDYNRHVSLGVAERVDAEVNRLKTLGYIPASQSYLASYEQVFDRMAQSNAFADLVKTQAPTQQAQVPVQKTPIESKAAPVTSPVQNNAKVAAAAPTKVSGAPVTTAVPNLANLPDDKFMEEFEKFRGRL